MKNLLSWLEVQLEWLKSFYSESDGKGSNRRLLGSLTLGAFLFSYIRTSLANQRLEDIPSTWAFLIIGILGLNIADSYLKLKNNSKE